MFFCAGSMVVLKLNSKKLKRNKMKLQRINVIYICILIMLTTVQ